MNCKKIVFNFFIAVILFTPVSCATGVNSRQTKAIETYKSKELYFERKNPETAKSLGFLPGIGSLYNGDFDIALCNAMLWPVSIVWEPYGAKKRAMYINLQETEDVIYRKKKDEVRELDNKLMFNQISRKEYDAKTRMIYAKYYNEYSRNSDIDDIYLNYNSSGFGGSEIQDINVFSRNNTNNSTYQQQPNDNVVSSKLNSKIMKICENEFDIMSLEANSNINKKSFMYNCTKEKKKKYIDLGL